MIIWKSFFLAILFCFEIHALQPIHLAVVACGDRLEEALNALKSALIFTPPPLVFHIFTEDHLRKEFEEQIQSQWPMDYQTRFELDFHPIEYTRGNDARWRSLFKPCCTQRLFIPDILQNVDSVIYIDTDVLFLSNARNLWRFFRKFNQTQLAALSPEHEDPAMGWYNRFARHPYYGSMGLNSGVMLMNLTRMRAVNMITEILGIFDEYHLNITWGDQCLLNIYFNYHPDRLYEFNCEWNYRPDHCIYENNCRTAAKNGVQILHGCRGAFHNDKYEEFKAIYQVIHHWNFDQNLKRTLLIPLQNGLKRFSSTNCGKSQDLFTKQFSREISTLSYSGKQRYHLALHIANDWNRIDQSYILLKSLLLFSSNYSNQIHLHVFITDANARHYFAEQIERLVSHISYYNTTIQHPLEMTSKLNLDRVIYLNPNMVFVNSLEKLWASFDQFNRKQVLGIFSHCHLSGFSNVLLLHLNHMNTVHLNIVGLNQLSTDNVYFLPCKYILVPDQCQSMDESLILPEMIDPSLFNLFSRTINQMNTNNETTVFSSMMEADLNRMENLQCRNELIELIKTNNKN